MNLLSKAVILATEAHDGQLDKGGQPYILHALRVMLAVSGEHEQQAAVLHDLVEDTGWSLNEIRRLGLHERVVNAVDCLTRRRDQSYDDYIRQCKVNQVARRVKIADLNDNLDESRIPNPTEHDRRRWDKYRKALQELSGGINNIGVGVSMAECVKNIQSIDALRPSFKDLGPGVDI